MIWNSRGSACKARMAQALAIEKQGSIHPPGLDWVGGRVTSELLEEVLPFVSQELSDAARGSR